MYMYTQKPSNFFDEDKLKYRFWWLRDAMFRIDFTKLSDVDIEKTRRNLCDILEGSDFFESFERSSILFKEWEAKYATLNGDSDSDIEFYRIQNDIRDLKSHGGEIALALLGVDNLVIDHRSRSKNTEKQI
ncbi:Ankyrin-2 [Fusarium oxysporum f. sp. albedinis]|nr:Ankyrin-2 [Fusarium oxysporum f. sp. albedinis]KAK2472101.1 hypothetical protein H9L39_15981 [Fusarium oxysporum f. sp. albedinis]